MAPSATTYPTAAPEVGAAEASWLGHSTARSALSAGSFIAVLALLCAAPFETSAGWVSAWGQRLTNVEVAAAIALLLSSCTWISSGSRLGSWHRLGTAWIVLVGILAVTAWLAPLNQAMALKAVGRLAAAGAVALAVATAATSLRRRCWICGMAVAVGVVVATMAVLESRQVPWALDLLTRFRPGIHVVGGEIRATSTLQYPTIASMHFEIVFGLGVGLFLLMVDRGRPRPAMLLFVSLLLIAEGVSLTFTRAGVATVFTSLAFAGGWRLRRSGFDVGVGALGLLGLLSIGLLGLTYSGEHLWLRLTTESQADWYQADFKAPHDLDLAPASIVEVPIEVTNRGRVTWHPASEPPFFVSYHWLDLNTDQVVLYDGLRTPLPGAVAPGGSVTMRAHVEAPPRPGQYRLAWDVVHENRLWFSTEGSPLRVSVADVTGPPVPRAERPRHNLPSASVKPGRVDLWSAALDMLRQRPIAGIGLDNFRWSYAAHTGTQNFDTRIHTNNMYLELVVAGGLLGTMALTWLLYHLAQLIGRVLARPDNDGSLGVGAVAAVMAVLVHGLVDSFLMFTPSYVMVAIAVGVLVSVDSRRIGSHAHRI